MIENFNYISYDNFDSKTSIGFYGQPNIHLKATLESGKMIRKYHPDAPIFLSFDGNVDLIESIKVADELNAEYLVNKTTIGYPQQPYGYRREKLLEWFTRFYIGFLKLDASHIMMWEEDSLFLGPVEFDENWDCSGHNIIHGNKIHPSVLTLIEDFSGKKPLTNFYGTGGCSIFRREPLLEHFHEIYKWVDGNIDWIQNNFYPTMGWLDCFTTIVYMLMGKDYSINPQLYNLDPHNPIEADLARQATQDMLEFLYEDSQYKIIHNWKYWYKEKL